MQAPTVSRNVGNSQQLFPIFSHNNYDVFLKEQTHQLKRLFKNIKYGGRSAQSTHRTLQPINPAKPPQRMVESATITPYQLEIHPYRTSIRFEPGKTQNSFRRTINMKNSIIKKPCYQFYRQKRKELQSTLFLNGKSMSNDVEQQPIKGTVIKKPATGRQMSFRLRMSLKKHKEQRYSLTPALKPSQK